MFEPDANARQAPEAGIPQAGRPTLGQKVNRCAGQRALAKLHARACEHDYTESMSKHSRDLLLGLVGGIGATVLLPSIVPVLSETARPIGKVLLKQTLLALERIRTFAARSSESLEDLIAEARAEVAQELQAERSRAPRPVRCAIHMEALSALPVIKLPSRAMRKASTPLNIGREGWRGGVSSTSTSEG